MTDEEVIAMGYTRDESGAWVKSLNGAPAHAFPITPASGTAAFLARYDPDSRQIAVRYDPVHRVRPPVRHRSWHIR